MDIKSSVLRSDLLEDLSLYLDREALRTLEEGGTPSWPDMTTRDFACVSIASSLLKKHIADVKEDADRVALEKFLRVNEACRNYRFPSMSLAVTDLRGQYHQQLLGQVRYLIWKFWDSLPTLSFHSILAKGRMGPGASIGALGQDFYTKLFSSKMTTTKELLYRAFITDVNCDPRWRTATELRYNHFGGPLVVRGNRLSFVPKTDDVSRTICTEPSLNMFYQLGLGEIICDGLRRSFGIDLAVQQDKNRRLARKGSASGAYGTIDLSSASDSISLGMLEGIMPKEFLDWLVLFRSSESQLPTGDWTTLHMISTMGNGYTFPLQTLIFTCVVLAVYQARGIKTHFPWLDLTGNFAVNGDDIIVVADAYNDVIELLSLLGFTPNAKKSFNSGFFRESCGLDAYKGVDVRGVYLKDLKTPQNIYSSVNRLIRWQSKHGVILPRLTVRLLSQVEYLPVPPDEDDGAGFHVPRSVVNNLRRDENGSILYKAWVARPVKLEVRDDEIRGPRKQRKRVFNPEGLLISFLAGYLRDQSIGLRLKTVRYDLKRRISPNWGYLPASSGIDRERWQHWENVARFYFD
jgi:hypothetical protein